MGTTAWGIMLSNPDLGDVTTKAGKLFRRRFRVPFPLFELIVVKCKEANVFEIKSESRVRIPLELKVLMCLRILGRGNCCDEIAELSESFESSVLALFKTFVRNFVVAFYDVFIVFPTGPALQRVMNVYARAGAPGAVSSMDCTHLYWRQCPCGCQTFAPAKKAGPRYHSTVW
jgi:hypothetical protein